MNYSYNYGHIQYICIGSPLYYDQCPCDDAEFLNPERDSLQKDV